MDERAHRWPYAGSGHVLTIDVEEYFQSAPFDGAVSPGDWDYLPGRLERCVDRWLDLLERHGVRASFFVLGWIADRYPDAVRRIAAAGHEIASRGWAPDPSGPAPAEGLGESVRETRSLLAEISGQPVHGFRSPRRPGSAEGGLLAALIEAGHVYDSSLAARRNGGAVSRPGSLAPYVVQRPEGRIVEVPTGARLPGGLRVPGPGGLWLRHLPYGVTRSRLAAGREARSWSLFRIRSWEIDPDQPTIPLPPLARFRQYARLERLPRRLERLFSEFRFASLADRLGLDEWSASEGTEPAAEALPATSGGLGA